jgi:predicted P-loop ATPase
MKQKEMTVSVSSVGADGKQPLYTDKSSITDNENKSNENFVSKNGTESDIVSSLSVDEVRGLLSCTEKGTVRQTIENCVTIFNADSLLAGAVRRNELTNRTDIVRDMGWHRRGISITDTDVNQIRLYMEKNYGILREKPVRSALDIISSEHSFHPIRDMLNGLAWDGKERIRHLLPRYLGADETEYVYEATKLMMLGAISRVFEPGCKFEIMLCLVGGQGVGKSTFFRFLSVKDEWFSDDLRKLEDDNVYRKMQGHWIIEMAEMIATSSAKSIEEIKAFVSRQKETYKIPYEMHPEDRPRQCIFVGTSNNMNFLPFDRSGNRRFAPVPVYEHRAVHHPMENEQECRAYILQCWAEAMDIYRRGDFTLAFSKEMEEQLKEIQKDFMPEDTRAGMIEAWLSECGEDFVCTKMIMEKALGETLEPNPKQSREISSIMKEFSPEWEFVRSHRFGSPYGTQRGWKRIKKGMTEESGGFVPVPEQMELPFAEKM